MYDILFYKTIDDYLEKRALYREEHLRLAKSAAEIETLVMASTLADSPDGPALIFKGDNPEIAEEFARNDPT